MAVGSWINRGVGWACFLAAGVALTGVRAGAAGVVLPVPPPGDPTWGDVVASAAGARSFQLKTETCVWLSGRLPEVSSRGTVTTRWPDAVRTDERRLAGGVEPAERIRVVGSPGRLTTWTWETAARRERVGDGAFRALMDQQMRFATLMGVALGPMAAGRLGPLEGLAIGADVVLRPSEGLRAPGVRVFELPELPAGEVEGGGRRFARETTRWLFAEHSNRLVGIVWRQPQGGVAVEMRVVFNPPVEPGHFAPGDPPGMAWVEDPSWGDAVSKLRGAGVLRVVVTRHEAVGDAPRVATFREELVVRRGTEGGPAWRSDWRRAEGAAGLATRGQRVVRPDASAAWWPDTGRVVRSEDGAAWRAQWRERRELLGRLGVAHWATASGVAGADEAPARPVPDGVRMLRTRERFPGRPAWRGYRLPPEAVLGRPDLRGVTYWFGAEGGLVRVSARDGGATWTAALEVDPALSAGFFALDDPPGFVAVAAPRWSDVVGFTGGGGTLRFSSTGYARAARGPGAAWAVTHRQAYTVRWPGVLRLDDLPVDPPRDASARRMVIGLPNRGLVQRDDGKAGVIYPGSAVFEQLVPVMQKLTRAVGRDLREGLPDMPRVPLDPATELEPAGLEDPGGRGWRAFRLPAKTTGAVGRVLAREVVYWFGAQGLELKGFSYVGRDTAQIAVVVPEADPVLPDSFGWIDRRRCGDWRY